MDKLPTSTGDRRTSEPSTVAPENRRTPKRKRESIPTIHFQVLLLLVSGRLYVFPYPQFSVQNKKSPHVFLAKTKCWTVGMPVSTVDFLGKTTASHVCCLQCLSLRTHEMGMDTQQCPIHLHACPTSSLTCR